MANRKLLLEHLERLRPNRPAWAHRAMQSRVKEKAETQMPVEYLYDKKSDAYCVEISAGDGLRQRFVAWWGHASDHNKHVDYVPPPITAPGALNPNRTPRVSGSPRNRPTSMLLSAESLAFAT